MRSKLVHLLLAITQQITNTLIIRMISFGRPIQAARIPTNYSFPPHTKQNKTTTPYGWRRRRQQKRIMTCTNNRIPAASFSRGARAAFHTVHQCVLNQCPCAILPPLPKLVSAKANCTPIYLSLQTTDYPPPPFTLPTFASSWRTNLLFFCFFCLVAICSNAAATVHIINRPFMYV